jgi:hypothetical protein
VSCGSFRWASRAKLRVRLWPGNSVTMDAQTIEALIGKNKIQSLQVAYDRELGAFAPEGKSSS